jgi:intracellular septation protein A
LAELGIIGVRRCDARVHDDYSSSGNRPFCTGCAQPYWSAAWYFGEISFRRSKDITLPDPVWARITWGWVAFLLAMGALNLYVAWNYSLDTWVNFKVWGGMGLFMLAAVGTVASVARYLPEQS